MKKIIFAAMIIFVVYACKKKADPVTPEPTPVVYQISVKIDGVEKKCTSCYSGSMSGGLRGSYFYLDGFNEQIYVSCGKLPAPGTYQLVKYGNPYLMYSKNNANRPAAAGSINITSIDTSAKGVINNLVASFSFKTDTNSSGVSYNITEGSINLKN
jgi:hypothetical protein